MKFKKTLIALFALSFVGSLALFLTSSPLYSALRIEILNNFFPETPDDDLILPFGYTLGPWPKDFLGEPIVTKLTYKKGPPSKFIDTMTQIWRPVEIELSLTGPKTVVPDFKIKNWRDCFQSDFRCSKEKTLFWERVFPEEKKYSGENIGLSWFESPDPRGARGVHLVVQTKTYEINRFAVIIPNGSVQVFSLKSILSGPGIEAREIFVKTMGSLKVNEDLANSRAWIESKIKKVNVETIKGIRGQKERFERLILVQNWIYSYLSVNPTALDSFYHLAGITHSLAMDLLKTKERTFENQEAWILSFHPLLSTLIRYAKDFPSSDSKVKEMQALLEDFLLKQRKLTR
ncbi:MAG: hypothetical protein KGP28_04545 [Bdellovibrionales bacterium]|nr:hypothetical protein [Bdellovibrionales bacterium]